MRIAPDMVSSEMDALPLSAAARFYGMRVAAIVVTVRIMEFMSSGPVSVRETDIDISEPCKSAGIS